MKRILFTILVALTASLCDFESMAQTSKYSTYYCRRATLFEVLPVKPADIIFLGNSITDGGEWNELFDNPNVKNRGISGDITRGVFDRLESITSGKPSKIFLMIGINDMSKGISVDSIVGNIDLILNKIKSDSPSTKVFLQSLLPVSDAFKNFPKHSSRWALVPQINEQLEKLARRRNVMYINLFPLFVDESIGHKTNNTK